MDALEPASFPLSPSELTVPTLSTVMVRLISQLGDPHAGAAELAETVQLDPALTALLLKTCNSAFYARGQPIEDVRRAIVHLGQSSVRTLVIGANLCKALAADGPKHFDAAAFWRDSLLRALIAKGVAQRWRPELKAPAYLAGLLQDLGVAVLAFNSPEQYYQAMVVQADHDVVDLCSLERSMERLNHVSVVGHLAYVWNFPPELVRAVENHHTPPPATSEPLWALAYFVAALGIDTLFGWARMAPGLGLFAHTVLGLSPGDLGPILDRALEEFEAQRLLFDIASGEPGALVQQLDEITQGLSASSS